MTMNLVWVVAIILFGLWYSTPLFLLEPYRPNRPNRPHGEAFCGNIHKDSDLTREYRGCAKPSISHQICHNMAKDNCRIPTWQLNDCWINSYKQCSEACNTGNCQCYDYATEKCRSNDDPAEKCYSDVHQECMAGMGYATDPDRGCNKGVPDCGCK